MGESSMPIVGPLFATPGMSAMSFALFAGHVLSLALMTIMLYEFRRIRRKYTVLLMSLGEGDVNISPSGRRLAFLYAVSTGMLTIGTAILYIWQPHLL